MGVISDSFLKSPLAKHDITQKFTQSESDFITDFSRQIWNNLISTPNWLNADVKNLQSDGFNWGHHPDSENFITTDVPRKIDEKSRNLLGFANLENLADIYSLRAIFTHLNLPQTVLATMYFPTSRADRTKIHSDGTQELIFLDLLFSDLNNSGVRGLIFVDPHSPAILWHSLKAGIAPLAISALPLLVTAAKGQGLFTDNQLICAAPDEGGRKNSLLVAEILGNLEVIVGSKERLSSSAKVTFESLDSAKVVGKTVVIADDMISTGATLKAAISKLLDLGASQIVILATYPVFSGQALSNLGFHPKIKIFATDGYTPLTDLSTSSNITIVPTKHKLLSVLKLVKSGIDLLSPTGTQKLRSLGFCHY